MQSSLDDLYRGLRSVQEARYAMIAMFCIQLYEWSSGIGREVRLIHRAPFSTMKILYILCRYYPFFVWILISWAYVGNHSWDVCSRVVHPVHALLAPCQFVPQAVMVMRAYAFAGRKLSVKILLGTCYAALLALDIWVFCGPLETLPQLFYIFVRGSGCFPNYGGSFMAAKIGYSILAATLMDLVSMTVMIHHCYRSGYHTVELGKYFVQQGLEAFGLVCCVNIVTAIAFFRPPRYYDGIGLPLTLIISNVMACRIILRLRAKVTPTPTQLDRQHSLLVEHAMRTRDVWIIENTSPLPR